MRTRTIVRSIFLCVLVLFTACSTPTPSLPKQLIYRDWDGAMPQAVLDAFEKETGIAIDYQPYETQEEVIEEIKAGKIYDVVVLENQLIQAMVKDELLAALDYKNLPNFKNISANFRDMAYDPRNTHSVPYSWGTTGMVVRQDLAAEEIDSWADMWDTRYAGKLTGWTLPRYMLGLSLKSLGYSLNSEDPQELEEATEHLIALKPHIRLFEWESAVSAPYLISGEAVIAVGQADDVLVGQEQNPNIVYVLPKEGGILWGDNWTIPANSPNKAAAEMFINFLLRGEISAQIINETYYWLPNDAALPLVQPEIRNNLAVFPSSESVKNSEIILALSPESERRYQELWERFLSAGN